MTSRMGPLLLESLEIGMYCLRYLVETFGYCACFLISSEFGKGLGGRFGCGTDEMDIDDDGISPISDVEKEVRVIRKVYHVESLMPRAIGCLPAVCVVCVCERIILDLAVTCWSDM